MQHKLPWSSQRFDEQAGRNICDNHDWNNPPKNEPKNFRENHVWVARNIEKIEISVDEPLGADDPKTHRRQAEHDGVMHRDAKYERGQVKQDRHWIWHDPEPG